jgi:hypothetical protein
MWNGDLHIHEQHTCVVAWLDIKYVSTAFGVEERTAKLVAMKMTQYSIDRAQRNENRRDTRGLCWRTWQHFGRREILNSWNKLAEHLAGKRKRWLSKVIHKELKINWTLNYLIRRERGSLYVYMVTPCNRWTNIYHEMYNGTHENWPRIRWSPQWQRQLFQGD